MKSRKTYDPCFCSFVPPHVLEYMAKASGETVRESSRDAARLSMIQDNQIRASRAGQVIDVATLVNAREGLSTPARYCRTVNL